MIADDGVPALAVTREQDIVIRGHGLAGELIGEVGFTTMFLLDLDGALPPPGKVRVVDAVLVTLMEHGITPSTLAARLVHDGAPESVQGAIAAGVLAIGSRFLGTIGDVAACLQRVDTAGGDIARAAEREVQRLVAEGLRVPGMGHNLHGRVDPRVARLFAIATEEDVLGDHHAALEALHGAAERESGRELVLNAAGAVGAILSDLGYGPGLIRGFAVVARSAGLLAHIADEQRRPLARATWETLNRRDSAQDAPGGQR